MISTVDEAMTIRLTKLLNIWESSRKLKAYQNDIAPKAPGSKAGAFLFGKEVVRGVCFVLLQ